MTVEREIGTMAEAIELTAPQLRALRHLASVEWSSPADLGEAMSDRKRIKAQGAGRVGGAMGTRLVGMGLAETHCLIWPGRGRYPAGYRISAAGRAAAMGVDRG